jgi:hypothetical protein
VSDAFAVSDGVDPVASINPECLRLCPNTESAVEGDLDVYV